jgi:hypothetical protein
MSNSQQRLNYVLEKVQNEFLTHNKIFLMGIVEETLRASDEYDREQAQAESVARV